MPKLKRKSLSCLKPKRLEFNIKDPSNFEEFYRVVSGSDDYRSPSKSSKLIRKEDPFSFGSDYKNDDCCSVEIDTQYEIGYKKSHS